MKQLGLDITEKTIKAILVNKNALQYSIIEKKSFAISSADKESLLKTLLEVKTYFSDEDIKVCVGIEAKKCFLRILDLPFSQKFKLNKILAFQLEEELPIDPNNLLTDMLFLNKASQGDSKILVLATKKKDLVDLVNSLNKLNFNLESLSPSQSSVSALLEEKTDNKDIKIYLNLNFSSSYLSLAKVYNGEYQIVQSTKLNYQLNNLISQLSKNYSISEEQAKNEFLKTSFIVMKPDLSAVSKEQQNFSNALSAHLKTLVIEIKNEFLKLQLKETLPVSIELYGEALCIKNILLFLQTELSVPVKAFTVPALDIAENLKLQDSDFINALGLVASMSRPKKQINFLQAELAPVNQKIKKFWSKNKSAIQMALAAWVFALIFGSFRQGVAYKMADDSYFSLKKIAKKTTKLKGRKLKLKSIKKIVKTYKKQKRSQNFFAKLNKKQSPIYFFNKISNMPRHININITGLNILAKKGLVKIKGYTYDKASYKKLENYLISISKDKNKTGRAVQKNNKILFDYTVNL